MIAFVRTIDADMRAARKDVEDNVNAPLTKYSSLLAQAMFRIYGTSSYPDATFTLRISYGSVAGYQQDGKTVAPYHDDCRPVRASDRGGAVQAAGPLDRGAADA